MSLSSKQRIFTQNIGRLIAYAYSIDIELTFGHAWRSLEEQKRLKLKSTAKRFKCLLFNVLLLPSAFNLFCSSKERQA